MEYLVDELPSIVVRSELLLEEGVCLLKRKEKVIVFISISLHVLDSPLESLLFDVKLFWSIFDCDFDVWVRPKITLVSILQLGVPVEVALFDYFIEVVAALGW